MRDVKIYVPPGQLGPLREFLPSLDQKLRQKLLRQIARLSQLHLHWLYWRRHVLSVCQT